MNRRQSLQLLTSLGFSGVFGLRSPSLAAEAVDPPLQETRSPNAKAPVAQQSQEDTFWRSVPTNTNSSLRGIFGVRSATTEGATAWTCGSSGTIASTRDAGKSWTVHRIDGLDATEFRSLHAWSTTEAIVATAGTPCRIYRTEDAGAHWGMVYEHEHPKAFLDGMRFWDDANGFAFGDPIDGKLMALVTRDSGRTWREASTEAFELQEGEAGFAASNSSLLVFDRSHVWIGLGGASGASSVLTSTDAGKTWKRVSIEEIPSGPTSGIFSIARNAEGTAIAVGGDFKLPERDEGNVAIYDPKTNRWRAPKFSRPRGYRSSVLAIDPPIDQSKAVSKLGVSEPDDAKWGPTRWIAAGPTGCDWSSDGERWYPLSDTPFHALSISKDGIVWASGGQGRVGFHPRRR